MRGCNDKITLWRREKFNEFTREVLPVKCGWHRKKSARSPAGTGFSGSGGVSVTIPYVAGLMIAPGDLLAVGERCEDITGDKPFRESDVKTSLEPDIITVQSVAYNLNGRGGHLKIEGI